MLPERGTYGGPCQETVGMIGDAYIRCGKTAIVLVWHQRESEPPYWMCGECANHNTRRRGAIELPSVYKKE